MEEPIQFFFPNSENVKEMEKVLRAQGMEVCRNKVEKVWIISSIASASFGYLYISRSLKNGHLHGFVLGRIDKERPSIAWIDVVCSRVTSKVGQLLMNIAEEHCRSIPGVKSIRLLSLPDPKLKAWYKSLGYEAMELFIFHPTPKAYEMEKHQEDPPCDAPLFQYSSFSSQQGVHQQALFSNEAFARGGGGMGNGQSDVVDTVL